MEWSIPITILCTLLGVGLGIIGAQQNRDRGIKRKQDKQDEQYTKMAERMTAIEASAKQVHKGLDELGK